MPNETDREEIEDEIDRQEADEETTEETRAWWLDEGCLLWSRYVIVPVLVALLLGVSAIIVALVVQDILQPHPTPTPTIFFKAVADVPTATPSPTATPLPTVTPSPTATNTPPPPPPCIPVPPGGWSPYLVKRGDTLFSLARRTGTTVTTIQQVNCLPNDHIYAMQELWLPAVAHPSRPGCTTYHTVVLGQTLYSIGRTYGVSPITIATANCICDMNRIYAGQILCIPTVQGPGRCCPYSQ